MSSGIQSPLPQPDFGAVTPWELSEEKKEGKNPEIETPNIRTQQNQNNQNSDLINQQNLPLVIIINQPPINSIAELIQQPLQLPPQQPMQQQPLQQLPQQLNINQMAYASITKLENFTGEENDAQA
ncbi:hypothetical protein G9A89_012263 [Geosiphon pyriformis]|nr:hypothetical protein G9A89_012263 [Geosiphon pyriformis]